MLGVELVISALITDGTSTLTERIELILEVMEKGNGKELSY